MYGINTYIYHKNQLNVGKSYKDGMGFGIPPKKALIFSGVKGSVILRRT